MNENKHHKPGYKHTPLGWIPEEWQVKEFGKFATLSKGKYVPLPNENIKCVELEHINQVTGSINGFIKSSYQKSTKNVFSKGQVLFGKLRPYLRKYWLADFDGVCSSEIWVLQSNSQDCCNAFLFRLIQHHQFIQVANVSSGSKMPRADWDFVAQYPFALPTVPEQLKISAIDYTWDNVITKTQQLIVKLQQRNKGLMQQLLTGKKRLKGFESEWRKINFGECFEFIKSYSISRDGLSQEDDNALIYCIHYGDIHALYENEFLDFSSQHNIPQIKNRASIIDKKDFLKDGDIIIADASEDYEGVGEAVEVVNLNGKNAVGGLHTIVLRDTKAITSNKFRAFLFASETIRNELRKKATGTSVYSVTKTTIKFLQFSIPENNEQMAIANVLHNAIQEVKLYEQKLAALQQQKKGLMQKLLTGEVRVRVKV